MDQAEQWAAITEEQIRVTRYLHIMNPRISPSQTGQITRDAVRIAREAKAQEKELIQKQKQAEEKGKPTICEKQRKQSKENSSRMRLKDLCFPRGEAELRWQGMPDGAKRYKHGEL
jgi:hypothetical protein